MLRHVEYFTSDGTFWLPDQSDRSVPGTLTFDPDGLAVRLRGSLHPFKWPEGQGLRYPRDRRWQTVPVVHGRLYDGPAVTLLGVAGINMAGPLKAVETWRVEFTLSGRHVTDDLFDQAQFGFDMLTPWTRPPGIATDGDGPNTVHADASRVTLIETATETGTQVRLLTGVEGSWDQSRVHLDQWCQFEAAGDARPISDVLNDWVRPLQDLLIVSLGRPVRLTSLFVANEGEVRQARLAVSFNAVQPSSRTPPTRAEIETYDAPTLVTRSDSPMPVEALIASWHHTRERLRDAVTLLCVPFYAPFIYSEHRYASTFQAAEALAHELCTTTNKSKEDHRRRVETVTSAISAAGLDEETVKWATAILAGHRDKSLPRLIEELTRSTGEVGERILEAIPTFPQDVARARVGVSHGGAQGTDPLRRCWLGDVLSWIIRVRMLSETGLPLDALVSRTLPKPRFTRAIRELSPSDGSSATND